MQMRLVFSLLAFVLMTIAQIGMPQLAQATTNTPVVAYAHEAQAAQATTTDSASVYAHEAPTIQTTAQGTVGDATNTDQQIRKRDWAGLYYWSKAALVGLVIMICFPPVTREAILGYCWGLIYGLVDIIIDDIKAGRWAKIYRLIVSRLPSWIRNWLRL